MRQHSNIAAIFFIAFCWQLIAPASYSENLADPIVDEDMSPKALALFEKGHKALDNKDLRSAEAYYRRAIEEDPAQPRFHRQLAYLLLKERRIPEAEREARVSIAQNPNDWKGLIVLGSVLHTQRRYDEEAETYKRALPMVPADQAAVKSQIHAFLDKDMVAKRAEEDARRRKKELEEQQYRNAY